MTLPADYYDVTIATWPDLLQGRAPFVPARIGVDRKTGKMLVGWNHVRQSMEVIFATPFHQRVLRRWVGSFVPHILGESGVARIISRFFWAIASAIDLWEPCYRVKKVYFQGFSTAQVDEMGMAHTLDTAVEQFRLGHVMFRTDGIYMPRGHLGDFTPESRRKVGLVGRGHYHWDAVPVETGVNP